MPDRLKSRPFAIALLLVGGAALSGCLTPRVKAPASAAVVEARQRVTQKAPTCGDTSLADVSPTSATFPFDDSLLDEMGAMRMRKVTAYLACHPQTPVVILPAADHHGDPAHEKDLAGRRAQAVTAALREGGATNAVIRMVAMGGKDPLTEPHILINAEGRGW